MSKQWSLDFISEENFTLHVKKTIKKYSQNIKTFDLKKFNSNIIDPIKFIFDKTVYNVSWEEIIKNEIFRQIDKSNNNNIGYFHQNIFKYITGCDVPISGWDVVYRNKGGIDLPEGETVKTIYVEIKNKHNTMNYSSSAKTYIKMQHQLLSDDDCACFLVEVISKASGNIKWTPKVDGSTVSHKRIWRVSIDKFYHLVTGVPDAFYQLCVQLPIQVLKLVKTNEISPVKSDTVLDELRSVNPNMLTALYILAFKTYDGFGEMLQPDNLNSL